MNTFNTLTPFPYSRKEKEAPRVIPLEQKRQKRRALRKDYPFLLMSVDLVLINVSIFGSLLMEISLGKLLGEFLFQSVSLAVTVNVLAVFLLLRIFFPA
jgi:hypothetical protein